jgi:hypothetical protein
LRVSWWEQVWLRVLTWVFVVDAPRVYGGNLAFVPPAPIPLPLRQPPPSVRCSRPAHCRVKAVSAPAQVRTVRRLHQPQARVHAVCAPSARARLRSLSLKSGCRVHQLASAVSGCRVYKLVRVRATLPVSHRVLLCRCLPAVRARVRLLPRQAQTRSAKLRWQCRAQQATIQRFRSRAVRSSLVWRLPIARYAVPFEQLRAEYRRQCREALQRAAKGYARVQSVYYPVPAHAVARIEIDERIGVLYVHPRSERADADVACLWVVSGMQVTDGRPVRALFRVM